MNTNQEQFTFKAEINELMNMIIHNFYSNKDIFLRELISNASDAINKLKHESLQNISLLGDYNDFLIKIKVDKEQSQIMIEDTGIGMDKSDLINNLGTIAKSGNQDASPGSRGDTGMSGEASQPARREGRDAAVQMSGTPIREPAA